MYTPGHSRILSTGSYTPPNVVTSQELMRTIDSKNRFDVDYDWLERITGIKTRHACDEGVLPSDIAVHAGREALEHARCAPEKIDAIIYAGMTRDKVEPSTAHIVQHKLQAKNAVVMDITNACLGFMSAIHVMDSLIATGQVRRGLIVTGEQGFHHTKINIKQLLKTHDREKFNRLMAGLTLGDAGGAMLLGPKTGPDSGIMEIGVASAGEHFELCTIETEMSPIFTDMPSLFSEAARLAYDLYLGMMNQRLKWSPKDIDQYIPHQVGMKGIRMHARAAGIDISRIPNTVSTMGNIISATIPYALSKLHEETKITYGQKVYFSGLGSGISVAQAGIIWDLAA